MPPAVTNGIRATARPEDRDDHGAAGEDDRPAGGGQRAADRVLDVVALGEVLAVAGDARRARSRCRRRGRPSTRSRSPSSGCRRRTPPGTASRRRRRARAARSRSAGPSRPADPNASSRITIATSRPSASPTPAGACSNAKYRSPPASIRSWVTSRRSSRADLRFARSCGPRSLRARGTGRGPAPPRPRSSTIAGAEHVGSAASRLLDPGHVGLQRGRSRANGRVRVRGVSDDVGAEPHLAAARALQQLGGVVRVEARCLERVRPARVPKAAEEVTTRTATTTQAPMTTRGGGRRSGPGGRVRGTWCLLGDRGPGRTARGRRGSRHIGARPERRRADRPRADQPFGRSAGAVGSLR